MAQQPMRTANAGSPHIIMEQIQKQRRLVRSPKHTASIINRPWQITPFMIAPVLPGETLKRILYQCRTVTDPLNNKLGGWWHETYFFYVKHRDLAGRADFVDMHLQAAKDMSAYTPAARLEYYEVARGGIGWVGLCLNRIVEEYFRDQDEAVSASTITCPGMTTGLPGAQIGENNWMQSLFDETAISEGGTLPDEDAGATYEDLQNGFRLYEQLRQEGMVDMSFEDFLATHGVKPRKDELHRPELLRYIRQWAYPTNTVEPTTGVPSTAGSWSINERADKDRYFREPGFIIGINVMRPKVYFQGQLMHAASALSSYREWLPATMADDPSTSVIERATTAGPIDPTPGYLFDAKDLFLYGDQFINHSLARTDYSQVTLPDADTQHRYADSTDAANMFLDETNGIIRHDMVVNLEILGVQADTTPIGAGGLWR